MKPTVLCGPLLLLATAPGNYLFCVYNFLAVLHFLDIRLFVTQLRRIMLV